MNAITNVFKAEALTKSPLTARMINIWDFVGRYSSVENSIGPLYQLLISLAKLQDINKHLTPRKGSWWSGELMGLVNYALLHKTGFVVASQQRSLICYKARVACS